MNDMPNLTEKPKTETVESDAKLECMEEYCFNYTGEQAEILLKQLYPIPIVKYIIIAAIVLFIVIRNLVSGQLGWSVIVAAIWAVWFIRQCAAMSDMQQKKSVANANMPGRAYCYKVFDDRFELTIKEGEETKRHVSIPYEEICSAQLNRTPSRGQ